MVERAPASIKDDAAANFEAFTAEFVKRAKKAADVTLKLNGDMSWVWSDRDDVSLNVEKTNSLMSPFLGTITSRITVAVKMPSSPSSVQVGDRFVNGDNFTLTFAAQRSQCFSLRRNKIALATSEC